MLPRNHIRPPCKSCSLVHVAGILKINIKPRKLWHFNSFNGLINISTLAFASVMAGPQGLPPNPLNHSLLLLCSLDYKTALSGSKYAVPCVLIDCSSCAWFGANSLIFSEIASFVPAFLALAGISATPSITISSKGLSPSSRVPITAPSIISCTYASPMNWYDPLDPGRSS